MPLCPTGQPTRKTTFPEPSTLQALLLDVYTQAISPAKHAAQAAVLALVFASETNSSALA
jgi:hypothetical protein